VNNVAVAIIGSGPYGLSVAAHLAARNVEHRIFGRPMQFWSQIADAGGERYLKSYCFGTNISTPKAGFAFADYSRPRGLETFEPCPMRDFAAYGKWFQQNNVPGAEPVDVAHVARRTDGFGITLTDGERFSANQVVLATGLAYFANVPPVLRSLPPSLGTHTSRITSFAAYKGQNVAVIGAGQSALEAAALLREVGAKPELIVREDAVLWHTRVSRNRSLLRRLRSPISGLGAGPKAWALTRFPSAMHQLPASLRTRFVKSHLGAEGAWWLRERVEDRVPIHYSTKVVEAHEAGSRVALQLRSEDGTERQIQVDHVVSGSGYNIDVDRLTFLDPKLRGAVDRLERAPRLNSSFESSVPGLRFVGPTSAMSFGPLFRFVVGAEHTAHVVSKHLASQVASPRVLSQISDAA
jgi:thioredoxin reductase